MSTFLDPSAAPQGPGTRVAGHHYPAPMPPAPTPSNAGPLPDLDLAVIGLGNMGGAILAAALDTGVLRADRIGVVDTDPGRVATFSNLGCRAIDLASAGRVPRLLLAVKPQVFPQVASEFGPVADGGRRLAISVMAGLRASRIADALGAGTAVVRTMPNTPAAIRLGITTMAPGPGATPEDLDWTRRVFESVGSVVELDESHFHAVTATSGSGPAWVFRLAEAWIAAAVGEGLPEETARRLVIDTMHGAANLLHVGDRSPSELREAVTSKGGTTAAGLAALSEHDFDAAVGAAIGAATARGRELDA